MNKWMLVLIALTGIFGCQNSNSKSDAIKGSAEHLQFLTDSVRYEQLMELMRQKRFEDLDSAVHYGTQAKALADSMKYDLGIVHSKISLGGLKASQSKYEEGLQSAKEAHDMLINMLSNASSDQVYDLKWALGNAHNVMAHNRLSQGNNVEGIRHSFDALKVREEIGDSSGICDTEYNIGNIYFSQNEFDSALVYYNRSLNISKELGNELDVASTNNTIGWTYFDMGRYAESEANSTAAKEIAERHDDPYSLIQIYFNLARVNEVKGNYAEAEKYCASSLDLANEIGVHEMTPEIENLLGLIYLKTGRVQEAEAKLKKALTSSSESGSLQYQRLSYENLANLAESQGDYKAAYDNHRQYILFKDSMENDENTKKLVQSQMQHDFDKKEAAQKAEQEKEDIRQKNIRNFITTGLLASLVFLIVVVFQRNRIAKARKKSDELLLNILPAEVANELKATGEAEARLIDEVTVLFTDFKGFTAMAEKLTPKELVHDLHECFTAFDHIMQKHGLEKIKTIGDAYMAAGGLPTPNTTHANDVVKAALEIRNFMEEGKAKKIAASQPYFEIRIGVHSGPVVAGIVGVKKFSYDIWGDTVNTASRMESSGEVGKVNISGSTYELVKDNYNSTHRGKVSAKGKGEIDMYFVEAPLN